MRIPAKERMNYITKAQAQLYLCLNKFPIKKPDDMGKPSWKKMLVARNNVETAMGYVGLAIEDLTDLIKNYDK